MQELELEFVITSIGSMFQLFFSQGEVKNASIKGVTNLNPPSQFETCFVSYSHSEEDVDQTIASYSNALQKVKDKVCSNS
jgi:glutamate-1-semialdehyde 2,1-aminomutase